MREILRISALMLCIQLRQSASFLSFGRRVIGFGRNARGEPSKLMSSASFPELSPKEFKPFRISAVVEISENTKAFNIEASLSGMKTSSFIMVCSKMLVCSLSVKFYSRSKDQMLMVRKLPNRILLCRYRL